MGNLGGRYPSKNTPNSRSPILGAEKLRVEDMRKPASRLEGKATKARKTETEKLWTTKLVGLVGWWRRVEAEAEKEMKEKSKKETGNQSKISFIRKFFPEVSNSPGGSQTIRRRGNENETSRIVSKKGLVIQTDGRTTSKFIFTHTKGEEKSTTPKRRNEKSACLNFDSPSKRKKFSDNLKMWRDLENGGQSDFEGQSGNLEGNILGTMNLAGDREK